MKTKLAQADDVATALDATDQAIIRALCADGRLSNIELADRIGLSQSQISRRRQRIEEQGYIRAYHAEADAEKLGLHVAAFIHVSLPDHKANTGAAFRNFVDASSEIVSCHAVTGDTDFILYVLTTSLPMLNVLLTALLSRFPGAHTKSQLVLGRIKQHAPMA